MCVSAVCDTRLVAFFVVGLECFCGFCCVRRRFLRSVLCGWYTLGARDFLGCHVLGGVWPIWHLA